jgi:hypothetical protein
MSVVLATMYVVDETFERQGASVQMADYHGAAAESL